MKRSLLLLCLVFLWSCASNRDPGAASVSAQQVSPESIASARIHTELAANYYSRRQYNVALEELEIAIKAYSGYGPAYNMLGVVYMDLKEDAKAAQNFQQALKLDPNDSDANHNYGWFLCQRGDPAKSIAHFATALRNPLYPSPDRSLVNAGICSRKMNNTVEAEKYFKQALAIQPNQPQALYNLADMSYLRGDFEESRTHLTRFMRGGNITAEALWLAARTESRLGDKSAEASFASQLCRRFPESPECLAVKTGAQK